LFLLERSLATEVVLAAIEERQWVAGAIKGWELQLVLARMAERALLALLEELGSLRVKTHLFLRLFDAAETFFKRGQNVKLLEESRHQLPVLLLSFSQRLGRGLALVVVTHGVGSLVADTNVMARVFPSR